MFDWAEIIGLRALEDPNEEGPRSLLGYEIENAPSRSGAQVAITTPRLFDSSGGASRGCGILFDWRLVGSYTKYNEQEMCCKLP